VDNSKPDGFMTIAPVLDGKYLHDDVRLMADFHRMWMKHVQFPLCRRAKASGVNRIAQNGSGGLPIMTTRARNGEMTKPARCTG
jgi:hypothetical protein